MESLIQSISILIISLSILLFFGPIIVIVSIIGTVKIGPLSIDLSKKSSLLRTSLALIGFITWLLLYIPLIVLAFKSIPLLQTPTNDSPLPVVITDSVNPPTETNTIVPAETPVVISTLTTQLEIELPLLSNACISNQNWQVYTEDLNIPDTKDGCWDLANYGVAPKENGLTIFLEDIPSTTHRGIYTKVPRDADISFELIINKLESSEQNFGTQLEIGVIDLTDPTNGVYLFYTGSELKNKLVPIFGSETYQGYQFSRLYNYGVAHKVVFSLRDLKLIPKIIYPSNGELSAEPKSVPFTNLALWIGYKSIPGSTIDLSISNIQIVER